MEQILAKIVQTIVPLAVTGQAFVINAVFLIH